MLLDCLGKDFALFHELRPAHRKLFGGGTTVQRQLVRFFLHLPLEPTHSFHKKLVVEHAHDAGKLQSFEKRNLLVLDKREHPPRERQPARLAVQKNGGVIQ